MHLFEITNTHVLTQKYIYKDQFLFLLTHIVFLKCFHDVRIFTCIFRFINIYSNIIYILFVNEIVHLVYIYISYIETSLDTKIYMYLILCFIVKKKSQSRGLMVDGPCPIHVFISSDLSFIFFQNINITYF